MMTSITFHFEDKNKIMEKPKEYRKKPVVICAMQWTGNNYDEICTFIGKILNHNKNGTGKPQELIIETLEGNHFALINDWIIKGIKGEFYPCKPDIFAATYEEVK